MPTIYGPNTLFDQVRATVVSVLNALKTQMVVDGVTPRILAVYTTPLGDVGMVFPSVSVSIERTSTPFSGSNTGVMTTDFVFQVRLRVMIGNHVSFQDEEKLGQLYNSIINYFEERHILSISPKLVYTSALETGAIQIFDDNRTVGGEMMIMVRASAQFTQV